MKPLLFFILFGSAAFAADTTATLAGATKEGNSIILTNGIHIAATPELLAKVEKINRNAPRQAETNGSRDIYSHAD